jgi:predicted nucleic acid-binding protein
VLSIRGGAIRVQLAAKDFGMAEHRPLVFLHSNVVLSYLDGKLQWLFDKSIVERFRYAINPVVFQEVVLHGADHRHPRRLEKVMQQTDMLPVNMQVSESILPRARQLRNRAVHSNDLLVVGSAANCDYLLTSDKLLSRLLNGDRPKVLTPAEFHEAAEMQE